MMMVMHEALIEAQQDQNHYIFRVSGYVKEVQNAINLTRYEFLKYKVTRDKVSSNPQNSVVDFFKSEGRFFFS